MTYKISVYIEYKILPQFVGFLVNLIIYIKFVMSRAVGGGGAWRVDSGGFGTWAAGYGGKESEANLKAFENAPGFGSSIG